MNEWCPMVTESITSVKFSATSIGGEHGLSVAALLARFGADCDVLLGKRRDAQVESVLVEACR